MTNISILNEAKCNTVPAKYHLEEAVNQMKPKITEGKNDHDKLSRVKVRDNGWKIDEREQHRQDEDLGAESF